MKRKTAKKKVISAEEIFSLLIDDLEDNINFLKLVRNGEINGDDIRQRLSAAKIMFEKAIRLLEKTRDKYESSGRADNELYNLKITELTSGKVQQFEGE